jgi:hypothetical protein
MVALQCRLAVCLLSLLQARMVLVHGKTIHVDLSHPGQKRIITSGSDQTFHLDLQHRGVHAGPGSVVHLDLTRTAPAINSGFVDQEQQYRKAVAAQKKANDRSAANSMWTYKPPYYFNTLTKIKSQVIPRWNDNDNARAVGKRPYAFIPPPAEMTVHSPQGQWHVVRPKTPGGVLPSRFTSDGSSSASSISSTPVHVSTSKDSTATKVATARNGDMVITLNEPHITSTTSSKPGASETATDRQLHQMAVDLQFLKKELASVKRTGRVARHDLRLTPSQLRDKLVNAMGKLEDTIRAAKS